jgi:hypothetical protein
VVCVTGAGTGVDKVGEQEKLKARKMLENCTAPQLPAYALLGVFSIENYRESYRQFVDVQDLEPS